MPCVCRQRFSTPLAAHLIVGVPDHNVVILVPLLLRLAPGSLPPSPPPPHSLPHPPPRRPAALRPRPLLPLPLLLILVPISPIILNVMVIVSLLIPIDACILSVRALRLVRVSARPLLAAAVPRPAPSWAAVAPGLLLLAAVCRTVMTLIVIDYEIV